MPGSAEAVRTGLPQPPRNGEGAAPERDRGAASPEYALIVAFVSIALATAMIAFAGDVGMFIAALGSRVAGWGDALT